MQQVRLSQPFSSSSFDPSMAQLQKMNGLYTQLKDKTHNFIAENSPLLNEQPTIFAEVISGVIKKIAPLKEKASQQIQALNVERQQLKSKLATLKGGQGHNDPVLLVQNQNAQLNKEHVEFCKKRIQIAETIDYKKIIELDIEDKKSPAHQVFKWVLVTIYGEAENKYYWPNFQQQAIANDDGFDLKERLGKVLAINLKEDQKVKTTAYLQVAANSSTAPELAKAVGQIAKVTQIAKLVDQIINIGAKIRSNEKKIEKMRQDIQGKAEEVNKTSDMIEAYDNRIQTNEKYYATLEQYEKTLTPKLNQWNASLRSGKAGLSDKASSGQRGIVVNEASEERQLCQNCITF